MTEPDSQSRHELALNFARVFALLIGAGTLVRPLLVEMDPLFSYLGLLNTALALGTYLLIRADRIRRYETTLMIALSMVCMQPLLLVSGGVNSQFVGLIPIFPMAAAMLEGKRTAIVVCAIWLLILSALLAAAPHVPDLTGEPFNQGKTVSRALWALLGVAVATCFGVYYHNQSERMADQLRVLATSDHLTGLANRRSLEASLDQELARLARNGRWLSLLMLDVDHFKDFNDRYGHGAGDDCLQDIARGLQRFTRQGQDLVARYGGEEFIVMLTDTTPTAATAVAEKLRRAIAERPQAAGADPVTVTIGVASADAASLVTRDELIDRADRALYAGKAAGRNRVVHADALADAA